MHARQLTAQEKRFEAYVRKRGGSFRVVKTGRRSDRHIVFGDTFTQTTLVTRFDVKHEEGWEALLDMLNGTYTRALERHRAG